MGIELKGKVGYICGFGLFPTTSQSVVVPYGYCRPPVVGQQMTPCRPITEVTCNVTAY